MFYQDLNSEIDKKSIPKDQIMSYLQQKLEFEYHEDLLELDTFVLSNFTRLMYHRKSLEKDLVTGIETYYTRKLDVSSSPILDGSTEDDIEESSDIVDEIDNYHRWREYYHNHRENFTMDSVNVDQIIMMHRYLLQKSLPNECGSLRRIAASISGSEVLTSHPIEIENHLQAAIDELHRSEQHPIIGITKFHHQFLNIHPFNNGNGRVIRELTNNWLIEIGLPYIELPDSTKITYREALHQADEGNINALISYFSSLILQHLLSD